MSSEKVKAIHFPISKIKIGRWSYVATNHDDIVAKFYFARKKLLWEFLCDEEPRRLKRKIEMEWDDVSSLEENWSSSRDQNEILKIKLRNRPKFYIETNPQARKQTQWKQINEDFTSNHASTHSVHVLHVHHEVLHENLMKLLSNSFWSKLHTIKVCSSLPEAVFCDITYGSNNNNTTTNNSSRDIPSQTTHEDQNKSNAVLHHATPTHDQTLNLQYNTSTTWFAPDDLPTNFDEITEEQEQILAICKSFCVTENNNNNNQDYNQETMNVKRLLGIV